MQRRTVGEDEVMVRERFRERVGEGEEEMVE